MIFTPRARKLALAAHIATSVSWIGAVGVFLVLSIAGVASKDPAMIRSAYLTMNLIGWSVIVPLSFAALGSGILQSLGTPWGLIRYYWVLAKLVLTLGATLLLLLHQFTAVAAAARRAANPLNPIPVGVDPIGPQLIGDSGVALLTLLAITTLSVFKPWGQTGFGKAKDPTNDDSGADPKERGHSIGEAQSAGRALLVSRRDTAGGEVPRGLKIFIAVVLIVAGGMAALHHLSGNIAGHGP